MGRGLPSPEGGGPCEPVLLASLLPGHGRVEQERETEMGFPCGLKAGQPEDKGTPFSLRTSFPEGDQPPCTHDTTGPWLRMGSRATPRA